MVTVFALPLTSFLTLDELFNFLDKFFILIKREIVPSR